MSSLFFDATDTTFLGCESSKMLPSVTSHNIEKNAGGSAATRVVSIRWQPESVHSFFERWRYHIIVQKNQHTVCQRIGGEDLMEQREVGWWVAIRAASRLQTNPLHC